MDPLFDQLLFTSIDCIRNSRVVSLTDGEALEGLWHTQHHLYLATPVSDHTRLPYIRIEHHVHTGKERAGNEQGVQEEFVN